MLRGRSDRVGVASMTDLYAVIGRPIEHSKSPLIHHAFAEQTGQDLRYDRLLGRADGFAEDVSGFFAKGGCGLNVTVPFKETAWELCCRRSERAAAAAAVNTLWMDGTELVGDNTDGIGLIRDLRDNHGAVLRDRQLLLLGAGGAARGVLPHLLACHPARLVIANRTAQKPRPSAI